MIIVQYSTVRPHKLIVKRLFIMIFCKLLGLFLSLNRLEFQKTHKKNITSVKKQPYSFAEIYSCCCRRNKFKKAIILSFDYLIPFVIILPRLHHSCWSPFLWRKIIDNINIYIHVYICSIWTWFYLTLFQVNPVP
jgi:hypothetical protein